MHHDRSGLHREGTGDAVRNLRLLADGNPLGAEGTSPGGEIRVGKTSSVQELPVRIAHVGMHADRAVTLELSEMITIGLPPYWQAVAISLPIISAPPSPMNATTCLPGRRSVAATAIGIPEPIAPTTDDRNSWPGLKPI